MRPAVPSPTILKAWRDWAERESLSANRIGDLTIPTFMLTLLDLVDAFVKDELQMECPECHGRGGDAYYSANVFSTCSHCEGKGYLRITRV